MELSYWESRWRKGNIGFHTETVFPALVDSFHHFELPEKAVIVPLCGKSLDMMWLAEKGYHIVGVEGVELACKQFFEEQNMSYNSTKEGKFTRYISNKITLLNGDFYNLQPSFFGTTLPDFIYDRAAIVSQPTEKRERFAEVINRCSKVGTTYLLHTFNYNQDEMNGPPFSVKEDEINRLFGDKWKVENVLERSIIEQLKRFRDRGVSKMNEVVLRLRRV